MMLWMLLLQQQQPPTAPSVFESPVTIAALLGLVLAALAPHANKIAGAIIDVVLSLAEVVKEWVRGMKARNDIIVELREQMAVEFGQKNAAVAQVTNAQAATSTAQTTANEAQKNANESLRIANEANANLMKERADNLAAAERIRALEKQLEDERKARQSAELRAAALNAWNPSKPAPST